jgi:hypothetical protein
MNLRVNDRVRFSRTGHPPFRKNSVVYVTNPPDKHGVVQVASCPGDPHPIPVAVNLLEKVTT